MLLYEVSMDLGSLGKWTRDLLVEIVWMFPHSDHHLQHGASTGLSIALLINYRVIKDQSYVGRIIISNFGFPLVTKYDDCFTWTIIIADEQSLVNDKLTHNTIDDGPHVSEHPVVVITADVIAAEQHRTWYYWITYYRDPLSCMSARIAVGRAAAAGGEEK